MSANPKIILKKLSNDAENGDLEAQKNLALLYFTGDQVGIEKDHEKAKKWAMIAANRGNAEAQSILGNLLREENNYEEAIFWFEKAIAQGEFSALIGLILAQNRR